MHTGVVKEGLSFLKPGKNQFKFLQIVDITILNIHKLIKISAIKVTTLVCFFFSVDDETIQFQLENWMFSGGERYSFDFCFCERHRCTNTSALKSVRPIGILISA